MVSAEEWRGLSPMQAARKLQMLLEESGCPDADFDARALVEFVLQKQLFLTQEPLTAPQAETLCALGTRRAAREPLQYLLGSWPFLDFELAVGPGVLCPRADTEVVCEAAAETLKNTPNPCVLDLCAGSGCLGLGIKRLCPSASVTALEKSPEAFVFLQKNAAQALPGASAEHPAITPVSGDLFAYHQTLSPESLDLIVSNPPYLTQSEMLALQPEVQREPTMALSGGEDGGDFYRCLAEKYHTALRPGGWMVLEIGWQQQALLRAILQKAGWAQTVLCKRDYAGNDRVILAQKRNSKK